MAAADQADIRADVLNLLQNLKGVEPMKELFWSRLNYERVNKPTTRRGWPGSAAEVLVLLCYKLLRLKHLTEVTKS